MQIKIMLNVSHVPLSSIPKLQEGTHVRLFGKLNPLLVLIIIPYQLSLFLLQLKWAADVITDDGMYVVRVRRHEDSSVMDLLW